MYCLLVSSYQSHRKKFIQVLRYNIIYSQFNPVITFLSHRFNLKHYVKEESLQTQTFFLFSIQQWLKNLYLCTNNNTTCECDHTIINTRKNEQTLVNVNWAELLLNQDWIKLLILSNKWKQYQPLYRHTHTQKKTESEIQHTTNHWLVLHCFTLFHYITTKKETKLTNAWVEVGYCHTSKFSIWMLLLRGTYSPRYPPRWSCSALLSIPWWWKLLQT